MFLRAFMLGGSPSGKPFPLKSDVFRTKKPISRLQNPDFQSQNADSRPQNLIFQLQNSGFRLQNRNLHLQIPHSRLQNRKLQTQNPKSHPRKPRFAVAKTENPAAETDSMFVPQYPIALSLCSANHMVSRIERMGAYDRAKDLLKRVDPAAVFRPQLVTDWQGEFPLPTPLAEYFSELGPVDVWIQAYGNPYFLPSLSQLWAHQTGYRTHGITHERIPDWEDDWLVIADEGGDPFIFSRRSGGILHAYHGEGVWEPAEMFDSLVEMATTFAIIGDIVASAGRGLTDDDSLILPRYRQEARTRIGEFLRSHERADALVSSLGWD
jgi:hypothetical protein